MCNPLSAAVDRLDRSGKRGNFYIDVEALNSLPFRSPVAQALIQHYLQKGRRK